MHVHSQMHPIRAMNVDLRDSFFFMVENVCRFSISSFFNKTRICSASLRLCGFVGMFGFGAKIEERGVAGFLFNQIKLNFKFF